MKQKVLLIGSGLGALATALRLSARGYRVEIVEKFHQPGGRLNQLEQDGFTFDMGPSFFSMSYEFQELFESCGIKNPLKLSPLDPLYAVFFEGRAKPFLIHKNLKALEAEFAGIEPDLAARAGRYLAKAGQLFHDTEDLVIRRNHTSKIGYLAQLSRVPLKHTPGMFRSMWSELERHFDSEEVRVIFSLVAFFLGSTPFETPSVYSLLNYTELVHDGYWNVAGGMYRIVDQIKRLLEERDVVFHFNTEIKSVVSENRKITAVVDQHGKKWHADLFIANADAAAFRGSVLGRKNWNARKLDDMEWTLAPFTIYLGIKGKIDSLHHHNYFLGNRFREYSNKIFKTSIAPENPYYYVNVSSKSNPDCAPPGTENLFILCPVPDLRYKRDWSDAQVLVDRIVSDLSRRTGFDLEKNTLTKVVMTPEDWQNKFNLYRGSGLGLAHGLNQVGGFRPANKDEVFRNLYYVGASTVPGTGLPMVVISSKLVTERIVGEHERV